MATTYFPEVKDRVPYEGPNSRNPLAYKYFSPERIVAGKPMREHLKFAVAYWHTFRGTGSDPFGGGVYQRPWGKEKEPVSAALSTMDAMFEFVSKLGIEYYCFHDRDIAPAGETLKETHQNLQTVVDHAQKLQDATNVRLLWGTANLFSHPRYTHGAATNPDPLVFAHAATQVRHAIDATIQLGGTGYVFWGGREGYSTLLNTDLRQEREQLARFLRMAVDYAQRQGFKGMFFIEPKPMEPTSHQYDFDAATSLAFLREFGLLEHFMLNIEANHATLAGHTFQHELQVASAAGRLGSLDINRGDSLLGWDTDQFPTELASATWAMLVLLKQGGLPYGGLNFDAKARRGSFDTEDLFHAHIGGIDTFARALLIADRILQDGVWSNVIEERYAGFRSGKGQEILKGTLSLEQLEELAESQGEPRLRSGREEYLENLFNGYLYSAKIE